MRPCHQSVSTLFTYSALLSCLHASHSGASSTSVLKQTNAVAPGEILRHATSLRKRNNRDRSRGTSAYGYTPTSTRSAPDALQANSRLALGAGGADQAAAHVQFSNTVSGIGHAVNANAHAPTSGNSTQPPGLGQQYETAYSSSAPYGYSTVTAAGQV